MSDKDGASAEFVRCRDGGLMVIRGSKTSKEEQREAITGREVKGATTARTIVLYFDAETISMFNKLYPSNDKENER